MKNINYTFIIPHKNCTSLLSRCLLYVPRRADIQIIIIDDNSDENIVDFSRFPGVGEQSVEVYFTKEGRGAGYARNVGLKHAKGKWIIFADADDIFVKNTLSVIDQYIDSKCDIIYFHTLNKDNSHLIDTCYSDNIDNSRAIAYNNMLLLNDREIILSHVVPWSKMIRASVIQDNSLLFDEIPCSNDVMFSTKLSDFVADRIEISNDYLYCVTKATSRNLTSKRDPISGKTRLSVLLTRNSFLSKRGLPHLRVPPLLILWQFRKSGFLTLLELLFMIIKSDSSLFMGFNKFIKNPSKYLK